MDATARHKILYLVEILLMTFGLETCVHSQDISSFPDADDVWFSLNGTTYQNNSIVILEDIGEGHDTLLCVTNQTACCRNPAIGNWYFPNGTRVPSSGNQWDFHRTRGQMKVLLHRRRGGEEGIYRCEIPDTMNVTRSIYIGVYSIRTAAVFKGTPYQNNSNVTLEDIGEDDDALFCITNQTACCRQPYSESAIGNWFFPNGTRVPSSGAQWDFHRTRGQMVVHLQRRRGGEEGIYRCEIPDAMNVNQTKYIGVYSASTVSCSTISPTNTLQGGGLTTTVISTIQPTNTLQGGGLTTTVISTIQPTNTLQGGGLTTTVISTIQPFSTLQSGGSTTTVISTIQPTNTLQSGGSTTTVIRTIQPTNTLQSGGSTTTVIRTIQSTNTLQGRGLTTTVISTIQPTNTLQSDRVIKIVCTMPTNTPQIGRMTTIPVSRSSSVMPTNTPRIGRMTTIPVSRSSSVMPTNTLQSNGTTTMPVFAVVVVVIIILFIIVGVVILVVLSKKRKQQLEINKLQNVTAENKYIKLKLKQEGTTEKESTTGEYLKQNDTFIGEYSEIKVIPGEEEDNSEECLNQNNSFIGEYSEIKVIPGEEEDNSEECLDQNDSFIGEYSEIKVIPGEEEDNSEECLDQKDTFIGEYSEIKVIPAEEEDNSEECLDQKDTFIGEYSEIKVIPGEEEDNSEECLDQKDSEIKVIPGEEEDNSEECLDQKDTFIGEYSEIKVIPAESECTLPAIPSRHVSLSNPIMESNPIYQSMDQCCDSPSYTNVPQGTASDNIYTTPDTASSQTVETETINPSLFMGQVGSPSDGQNLLPYASIYTGHTMPSSKQHLRNSFS